MARDRANIRVDMLSNTDYRDLGLAAQHLYKLLLIHPTLNYAGVADWRPGRIAKITRGVTADDVRSAAKELQAGSYIYVDDETEEVFIRSFVRHDGLLSRYRLPIAMANAYADISSPEIRRYFVHELRRIHESDPDLKCWEESRVQSILREPYEDMKAISQGIGYGITYAVTSDELTPGATATTTATTTTNTPPADGGDKKESKRGSRIFEEWAPKQTTIEGISKELPQVDQEAELRKFIDHFLAAPGQKGVKLDWDATYRNWVRNSIKYGTASINESAPKQLKGFDF